MTNYHAIIFDLDDTLYPEQSFVFSGYRAVAQYAEAQWQIPAAQTLDELRASFCSGNRSRTFDTWLDAHQLGRTHVDCLIDVYRQHSPDIGLFDGLRALLAELSQQVPLGLISDGYLAVQKRKFESLNIADFFGSVVFSDQWGREHWKPDERPYLHSLTSLDVAASNAVYVGDNPNKDFITARALGMQTVRVIRPDGIYRDVQPPTLLHAANATTTSTDELRSALSA